MGFLTLCVWLSPRTIAAPPPNDTCAGAEIIPAAGPFPYLTAITDLKDATTNGDPAVPSCVFGSVNRGIWYKFSPPSTRLYTISCSTDTATTVPDTVMAIYTGNCANLSEVNCSDDEGDLQSAISQTLDSGVAYYILVWVSGASAPLGNNTKVQLRVTQPIAPPNDFCAGAENISPGGPFPYFTSTNDTTLANTTGDPPAPACWAQHVRSVWFRFTPNLTATYEFSLCTNTATTVYETVMAIYTSAGGCSGPFTQMSCNHTNPCGNKPRSTITTPLTNGATYYIVVWEGVNDVYIPGETSLQLRVARFLAPAATTLTASGITSTGAVLNASVNPNGLPAAAWFDWGPTANYGSTTPPQILGNASGDLTLHATLTGLSSAAIYHFRVKATNSFGVGIGSNRNFAWSASSPAFTSFTATNGVFTARFTGQPGQIYLIEASTNLMNWTSLGLATDFGNALFEFTNASPFPSRFFRTLSP